jgi:drug/metabolite transporter (DMT)-like permease
MIRALGFFYVLLAGIGFGFIGIFSRIALQSGLSVGELLCWRFFFASVILWVSLLLTRPELIQLSRKQILISAALGACGYALFSTLYFKAIENVSVPLAALLLFTFPLFVNLGSHFILKERMKRIQAISLALACVGLGILLWGPLVVNSSVGVLYGLGAAVSYAIYVLISGQVQKNVHPLSSSLYIITAAGVMQFIVHQPELGRLSDFSTLQLLCILAISLFSTIGPMTLFLAGLQRLPSSQASVVAMIEPVVAALAAWFLLGETLSNFQLVGAVIVLSALFLNALEK